MGVLRPLKVVIENYPRDQAEELVAQNHPKRPELGERRIPFSREIFIERDDFMEDPPGKYFRLAPGREVRLRYGYYITCTEVIRDHAGRIAELRCSYDPETRGGTSPDGRKVKGTIHWVSAPHAVDAEVRLYDRLFQSPNPNAGDFLDQLNPGSLEVLQHCKLEPGLADAGVETRYQLERQGYFCVDPDSTDRHVVLNRTVTLRDSWAKQAG